MKAKDVFKMHFPNLASNFSLKKIQEEVIDKIIEKQNTLAILPTGGGKSLIYWVSGLALEGISIVISPLTALIDEQVEKLQEQNISVLKLHAGIEQKEQIEQLKRLYNGELTPSFIFVSPERLSTDGLLETALKQRSNDIKLVVIDEIHCISQWGHSFRPLYTNIPHFLNNVFTVWPNVLGLSATLNVLEIEDIKNAFHIEHIVKDNQLMRTEIALHCLHFENEDEKEKELWNLLERHKGEKTLVYIYRKSGKRSVESFAKEALDKGITAAYFHSDVSSKHKQTIIKQFKENKLDIIFATNAFGMGMDIPDIKVVIHYLIPESIAQYYQEVGRASRNKQNSNAYLMYSDKNIQVKKSHFIDKGFPTVEEIQNQFKSITKNKIGLKSIDYYENERLQLCLPYLIEIGAVKIHTKAIHTLKVLGELKNQSLQTAIDATKTKGFLATVKKTGMKTKELADLIFEAILNSECTVKRSLGKSLIVEANLETIDHFEEALQEIINKKKQFKYQQLDYFVYTIQRTESSLELHQEIAQFLGVNKWDLNKIYATQKGERVRSKSEVIIANMLFASGIEYEYEKEIITSNGKKICPDFTLYKNDRIYYLEHVGMLHNQQYAERWLTKKNLYDQHYPSQLLVTYETPNLSNDIETVVNKFKQ
ncbi:RecQ family ATP-dependent DNA helicase [Bacillus tropicus]|uniref:RecQ family ATP-dependent DNA helicase n=1 Tax=Bacillus tropicus TaxID=2026188 RepID=UPI000BED9AE0|nr:recombinase RecQ [Bacillus cereus]